MNSLSNISVPALKRAIKIKAKLESLKAQFDRIMGGAGAGMPSPFHKRMSAAGRRRIAAAQKKRWAKLSGKVGKKGKREMSAAGRAKIAAAARARWAKAKADGKNRL